MRAGLLYRGVVASQVGVPSLVWTKLEPPITRGLVSRTELVASLVHSHGRLVVIRAPAGWGKTTLLADWSAAGDETRPFAWLHPDVDDQLSYLLEHLPAGGPLVVLASRATPALPLARLRVRGELMEIDPKALRFSVDEAAELVNGVHGLALAPDLVARLTERTEGWAAGLYLAVLSLRGRDDQRHRTGRAGWAVLRRVFLRHCWCRHHPRDPGA